MEGGKWVKKVEESHVSVSVEGDGGGSVGPPLTFLDIPWLLFPPSQPLFFFQLDHHHSFHSDVLPNLKASLSSALHLFYPLASSLLLLSDADADADGHQFPLQLSFTRCSVPLTLAVADSSHPHLISTHQPKDASFFRLLVPHLPPLTLPTFSPTPLFAIQITHFPSSTSSSSSSSSPPAFSIGFSCHPVLCDQRTFHLFLTTWASLSKLPHPPPPHPLLSPPSFDRSPIIDPTPLKHLHSTLLKQCLSSPSLPMPSSNPTPHSKDMLRATFVVTPTHIHNTRRWIMAQCDLSHTPYPALLSPYVVTCAIVWACFAQLQHHSNPKPNTSTSMYMGFIAGGITRLPYPVPTNYFGNCVAFGRAVAKRADLLPSPHRVYENGNRNGNLNQSEVGTNGSVNDNENEINGKVYEKQSILAAAHAISKAIKDLNADVLGQAHNWILDWEPIIGSDQHINMVGSPKVELYEIEFEWGTPKKIEEISIDGMRGRGVSLMQSRDVKGGIEIGVTLPASAMRTFSFLFDDTLAGMSTSV